MTAAAEQAERVARELSQSGYSGLFLAGDHSTAGSLWRGGEHREALHDVVRGERFSDLQRVLAAEVLRAHDDAYPPDGSDELLARVYAHALQITGTGDRPIVLTGDHWGFLYDADARGAGPDDGPLGKHLLAAGPPAVPHLVALLDDPARILYEGSQEATIGNRLRYRVKDAAAYYIGRLTGIAVAFHEPLEERDAEIERLKDAIASRA